MNRLITASKYTHLLELVNEADLPSLSRTTIARGWPRGVVAMNHTNTVQMSSAKLNKLYYSHSPPFELSQ